MKRTIIITAVFLILAIFASSGCTCKPDDETSCRGLGHGCIMASVVCFDCAVVDDSGEKSFQTYDVATEGTHYSAPQISLNRNNDRAELTVQMEIHKEFHLNMEICIVQDGVLLGTYEYQGNCRPENDFHVTEVIYFQNYNPDGGEIYHFVNRFEGKIKK